MKKGILAILILSITLSSCKVGRFFIYNFADINDHKKFPSRELKASETPFKFKDGRGTARIPKFIINGKTFTLDELNAKNKTVAFLIIRNDSIIFENYYKGYTSTDVVPSFSVAKSFTSALIGCAIADGYIKSENEPITNYIPELKKAGFEKVSIRHVLQMTSGLKFNESYYNPFGDAATFYYGRQLRKSIGKMKMEEEPGTDFEYQSGNTQLLGLILERALKTKTITQYLQEKIWTPLQMETPASWSIDKKKDGLEKTFCCINATAVDFAKFGRLYLNKGNWNGQQLVPAPWVEASTKLDTADASVKYYQYQWWIPRPGKDFMAEGILGQFIYVCPEKNLVVVRLGSVYGDVPWKSVFVKLAENL
jgi:CubicO group peptidase (beta-lactamase class C family)